MTYLFSVFSAPSVANVFFTSFAQVPPYYGTPKLRSRTFDKFIATFDIRYTIYNIRPATDE